jgi:hypothetical protein
VSASGHGHAAPSDDDGVRVIPEHRPRRAATIALQALAVLAIVAGVAYFVLLPDSTPARTGTAMDPGVAPVAAVAAAVQESARPRPAPATSRPPQRRSTTQAMETSPGPDDLPSGDPDDIATYVSPTDPEPTAAEVIQALHDIGDHTGIGAFNPPGTSPPLLGLVVPDDFELPPGYVRHHQVTDEGEPLEPILMFSPDVVFVDASGREVPIPEDRVVPPAMAPPGLPIREIAIPPKP